MQSKKYHYPTEAEKQTFTALLKHFGMYEPEPMYKVLCPFHDDKNASMQVNLDKAFFYCYAECGAKGSSLELYQLFHKKQNPTEIVPNKVKSLLEIKTLTRACMPANNTSITNTNNISVEQAASEKLSYKAGLKAARIYYNSLPEPDWYKPSKVPVLEIETREAKQYMRKRGFRASTLKRNGAKPSLNSSYPIIFPLFENGLFRGYVMRTFDPEVEAKRKYMYNRGFKRELVLAGEYKHETLLLVEGYLDVLKAKQLGIQNVAAVLGWKLTGTQLEKIKAAGIKQIICGLDKDEAGKKGYNYLKHIAERTKVFSVVKLRYPKGIKDMGEVNPGTKEASMILCQIKNLGGK